MKIHWDKGVDFYLTQLEDRLVLIFKERIWKSKVIGEEEELTFKKSNRLLYLIDVTSFDTLKSVLNWRRIVSGFREHSVYYNLHHITRTIDRDEDQRSEIGW